MPFSTIFQLYQSGKCNYPCLPGVLLTSTRNNILSKPLAAFPHNHCRKMDSSKRGMNPVVMTIFIPRKDTGQAGIKPTTSCSKVCYATN